ncbi:MAG: ABC transporter substrate-binding protein [Acidocella sp.]|nr:ABC transporter substrate-binding protein [Acidocella sp.]
MSLPKYNTVTRTQGNNRALKTGEVKPKTFEFDFTEFPVLVDAFRIMVREHRFDICEMAITTYITAKAYGKKFTAIPVFLVRGFHHGAIMVNTKAGINTPKDLEGKRVGVNRGYTVTTGVWARSVLQREHGVDLSKVTWVLSGDEHVAEYKAPGNVVPMDKSKTMADHLISGDLAAAIGVDSDHAEIAPLLPHGTEIGLTALRDHGYYPINHLVVIKDELWQANPGLATDVFNAFAESKQKYVAALKAGQIEKLDAADKLQLKIMEVMPDPLPYGIEASRAVIEELIENAITQGIITQKVSVDDLFIPETRKLVG